MIDEKRLLRMLINTRITVLRDQIRVVEEDRRVKLETHDDHGVRDACVDIETKRARINELEQLYRDIP